MTDAATAQKPKKEPEPEPELVKVTGRGRGGLVNFEIDDAAPVAAVCRALRSYLGHHRSLYAHGEVTINIGQRMLSDAERQRIGKVIEAESGLAVKQFWCQPEILERERQRIADLLAAQAATVRRHAPPPEQNGSGRNGAGPGAGVGVGSVTADGRYIAGAATQGMARLADPALLVRGACRAGESLTFPGDVIILGSVNPGAEIVAQGDIMVFGGLRGTAHAGAGGDDDAIILAMFAATPTLRIAGHSWRPEESDNPRRRHNDSGKGAIIARVEDGAIRVSGYLPNHAINHGGIANEW